MVRSTIRNKTAFFIGIIKRHRVAKDAGMMGGGGAGMGANWAAANYMNMMQHGHGQAQVHSGAYGYGGADAAAAMYGNAPASYGQQPEPRQQSGAM